MKRFIPLIVFVCALCLYAFSAGGTLFKQSSSPQYVYLAFSFLHGKLNLVKSYGSTYDLILFKGEWYVPGGLAPALLMMPLVALFGLGFSDIFFSVFLGAISVTLLYDLLGHLGLDKNFSPRIWLTTLFAAGTVFWWVTSLGFVWFNAQVVAVLFMILFVRETLIDKRPWLAGIWLAMAALARPTTLFAAAFYIVFIIFRDRSTRLILRKCLPFVAMLGTGGLIILAYNFLRFGGPFDFGYEFVQGNSELAAIIQKYGSFSLNYAPCNLYISIFGMPIITNKVFPGINQLCWYLASIKYNSPGHLIYFNPLGMSIFLTTPAFFYIFKARLREPLIMAAWAGIICIMAPLLMYYNTGFLQFGYRYILDVIVFVFIMLASVIKKVGRVEILAILTSVLVNFAGMTLMFSAYNQTTWIQMWGSLVSQIFH
jgi:hypothetical protein